MKPPKQKLDPDGGIGKKLLGAQVSLKEFRSKLIACWRSAGDDSRLRDDDGIVDAYQHSINAVAELHNKINALRWAIGEHDADLAKITGKFASIEALGAHLNR